MGHLRGLFANLERWERISNSQTENFYPSNPRYSYFMDKKEINSPKLTARFLIWISGFVLLMLVVAHFLLRWF
jgi:hypothetical protein